MVRQLLVAVLLCAAMLGGVLPAFGAGLAGAGVAGAAMADHSGHSSLHGMHDASAPPCHGSGPECPQHQSMPGAAPGAMQDPAQEPLGGCLAGASLCGLHSAANVPLLVHALTRVPARMAPLPWPDDRLTAQSVAPDLRPPRSAS